MTQRRGSRSAAPPRWALRVFWVLHRAVYAITGGRLGLRSGAEDRLGTLRLRTIGRSSGKERPSMLFYLTDDPAYVVVATNAGANHDPAWWLNLQAQPRAEVDLPDGSLTVRGREAVQEERTRLWARVVAQPADYAGYAAAAGRHIVVLEPIEEEADA